MSTEAYAIGPRLLFLLVAFTLAGCQSPAERDPLPYSPNYHVVQSPGAVTKGYENQTAGRLVPDACVTPDVTEDPMYLPPGCANNMNLLLMAERQNDLLQGRKTGPAMAAPVVRAAQNSINGVKPARPPENQREPSTTGLTR